MLNDDIIRMVEVGINDQAELLKELKNLGYVVTQSSISRKLKSLGIVKLNGRYQMVVNAQVIKTKITFVYPNMIVIRTPPGNANPIAAKIDLKLVDKVFGFIGCIAGDDTIFVAIDLGDKDSSFFVEKIREIM
jgi:transcriptional regulator of arginine metabolism